MSVLTLSPGLPAAADDGPQILVPAEGGVDDVLEMESGAADIELLSRQVMEQAQLGDLAAVMATIDEIAEVTGGPNGSAAGSGAVGGGPSPIDTAGVPGSPGARPEGPGGTGDGRSGDHGGMLSDVDCWGERVRASLSGELEGTYREEVAWTLFFRDVKGPGVTTILRLADGGNMQAIHLTYFENGDLASVDGTIIANEDLGDGAALGVYTFSWEADPEDHGEGSITSQFLGRDPSDSRESDTRAMSADEILDNVLPRGDPRQQEDKEEVEGEEPVREEPADGGGSELSGPDGSPDHDCDGTDRPTGHEGDDEPGTAADITIGPGAMPGDDLAGGDDRLTLPVDDWTWVIDGIDPTINPPD